MRALVLAVLCAAGPAATAAEKTPVAAGDWSEPVDGLRGRLLVYQGRTLGDGKARATLVYVELKNVAEAGERWLTFDPDALACELLDAADKKVAPTPVPGSGGRPGKSVVTVPFDSSIRLRANPYAFGRAEGLLIPLNATAWHIKDGADYFLSGTLTVPQVPWNGPGKPPWAGKLKLPKARVVRPAAAPSPAPPVGQGDDPNPVFDGWKGFKPGTSVTLRQAQNSNGALTEALVTYTLVEVGPDGLVLEGRYSDVKKTKSDERPVRVEMPRRIRLTAADREELNVPLAPAGVYEEGTETVTVSGTACKARWYRYRGGAGDASWEGRKWLSADVPGGLLKTEVTEKRPTTTTVFTIEVVEVKITAAPVPKGVEPANLIVNGSFEDIKDDEASRPQDKDSTAITGWTVTRGQIDVTQQNGNEWKAHHGERALDLHGSPGFGGVEQTIATKPGKRYKVMFRMSGNPGVPEHKAVQLGVRAAGQDKEFELSMEGRTYEDLKWEGQTWEFTAKEKATTIEFHTAMPVISNAFGGPLLDDVKVVEVN